ncbi:MAG: ribose-5-phosphate isomerase RpiA [Gammaproteobacteria bacterium]
MSSAKEVAAKNALDYILPKLEFETVVGIGTGSTSEFFIDALSSYKHLFKGAVSSSERSTKRLKRHGISVFDVNLVNEVSFYVDGADECDPLLNLIKGGGGAHTKEKIIATIAKEFLCIIDESKLVEKLGAFGVPVEVLNEARSFAAREIIKLGGTPLLRTGILTESSNPIIDIRNLDLSNPQSMEIALNKIPGIIENGIFAIRKPDQIFVGK